MMWRELLDSFALSALIGGVGLIATLIWVLRAEILALIAVGGGGAAQVGWMLFKHRTARWHLLMFGSQDNDKQMLARARSIDRDLATFAKRLDDILIGATNSAFLLHTLTTSALARIPSRTRRRWAKRVLALTSPLQTEYYRTARHAEGSKAAVAGELFLHWKSRRNKARAA